jgi:hypothetical protein
MVGLSVLAAVWAAWHYPESLTWVIEALNLTPKSASLDIQFEEQLRDYWCWAASADMVVNTLKGSAVQCETAQLVYPKEDCCNPAGPSPGCDRTGWPPFYKLHFQSQRKHNKALTFQQLMGEIGIHGRPVAFSWEYTDTDNERTGLGHMMVAGGYEVKPDGNWVEVYDPLCDDATPVPPGRPCGYRLITYSQYDSGTMTNQTTYAHWDDFYGIKK